MWFILITALIIVLIIRAKKNTNSAGVESVDISLSNPQIAVLIDEAVSVINDMLEVGSAASLHSLDYEGFIIAVPSARPPFGRYIDYGFYIKMVDACNLKECQYKYPAMRNNPDNREMYEVLDSFVNKYGNCYSDEERGYVYETRATAPLRSKNEDDRELLRALLHQEVSKRCLLADMSRTPIHTKTVYY